MFQICTTGCGRHARIFHGPSQRKYASVHPDAVLSACCDLDGSLASGYREEFGFARHYDSVQTLLENESPEAGCLILPPKCVPRVLPLFLARDIPVLVEKPPALTLKELEHLISLADGSRRVQVAFNRRYAPLMVEAMRILNDCLPPEDVFQINYEMIRNNRCDKDFSTTAVHAIDGAMFLARSPYRFVEFQYQEMSEIGDGVASVTFSGEFSCGTNVRCNFQPVAGATFERISVHGPNFTMSLRLPMWEGFDSPGLLQYWRGDKLVTEIRGSMLCPSGEAFEEYGFYEETRSFFDNIRGGKPVSPGLEACRQPVALMEAFRNRERFWSSAPQRRHLDLSV